MKFIQVLLVSFTFVVMTGCAGTNMRVQQEYTHVPDHKFVYSIIEKDDVTPEGMSVFENRLSSQLQQLGLYDDDSNLVVQVTFKNYYMRHGATRFFAGAMAGSDNITTAVILKNKDTGKILGQFQVVSKNPTAMGTARGLIEGHADKIVQYIKTGKTSG